MNEVWFILLLVAVDAILLVTDFQEDHDSDIFAFQINLANDGIHSTSANVSVSLLKTWISAKCYLKVSLSSNQNDRSFSIEVLNTVFDMSKLLNGVVSNVFMKSVLESVMKSIEFEPKFPFKPGVYRVTNFSADENLVPLPPMTKAFADVRFVGKIKGIRKSVVIQRIKVFFEKR